ncbi:MAG: sigma-54-dependent Fis family transcriptional regulator [Calditrichia bacterium]|jgi:DNA-binding NtrC family response regulator|nr:sigma-54-dependent Fis family transcriptional regulator [Calditrichia bacterium]
MSDSILVIDDDQNLLKSLKKFLTLENYSVDTLVNAVKAEELLEHKPYRCLLLDVKMPVISGMDILKNVIQKHPSLPVIMISGQSGIEIAVQAIKAGAFDFIEKPINPERLIITVRNALRRYELQEMNESIFKALQEKYRLIGQSNAIKSIFKQIEDVADTPAKVLIMGESGTGKELVAWAIHHNSARRGKPYIKLNCAAIPSELLESEIFGHRKGSFTGAVSDRRGKFIEAHQGTLFLDEIGDMSLQLQAKLLRALEENEVEVIGENLPVKVDIRIIAATNQNLQQLIADGKFREDLYYRLNVVKILIPPLRERPEDILPLTHHFLNEFSDVYNKPIMFVKSQAEALLINYDWPGNVRQLRNVIEKIMIFCHSPEIGHDDVRKALDLGFSPHDNNENMEELNNLTLKIANESFEKKYILAILQKYNWKIGETARNLGIDRSNLFKKMRKHGLHS